MKQRLPLPLLHCMSPVVCVLLLTLAWTLPVEGRKMLMQQQAIFLNEEFGGEGEAGEPAQVADFPTGATLPTDTEVDRILKRADEYVRDGRYDLAAVVWQKVLDGTTSVLRSEDGRYYTSVQAYVEEQLDRVARQAPDGLREYRLKADGEARELIAQAKGKDEEKSLSDVVRRFFYSSLGDDAAYTLGCLMLDRYEFVAATRLFASILTRHPDYTTTTAAPPNLSRSEIMLRLAVSSARSGDGKIARAALDEYQKLNTNNRDALTVAWVDQMIDDGGGAIEVVGNPAGEWHATLGGAMRDGRMTGLPLQTAYTGVWEEKWIAYFNDKGFGLNNTGAAAAVQQQPRPAVGLRINRVNIAPNTQAIAMTSDSRRKSIVEKWKSNELTPTDAMLLHAGRVYFRAYDRVVCVDGRTGKQMFSSPSRVAPQVRPFQTSSPEEILLFGDRASGDMTIQDDVLYYLEEDNSSHLQQNNAFHRNRAGVSGYSPQFGNRIVALDAITGKLLWRSPTVTDESGNQRTVRYQAAPVAYGNLLLVPTIDNGALWLHAYRSDRQGEVAWRTFLADDPPGGYNPWVTTGLSIAGGDAYLTFAGVVFNVEASGGIVRWASRYPRDLDGTVGRRNYGNQSSPSPHGWDDDVLIPAGRAIIVAANDRDAVMAFDRRTGRFLWDFPRDGATHILGTSGRYLFVAGRNVIRKYDMLGSGLLKRERDLEWSITGRGFVTEDAIYLPVRNAVARIHPDTFKVLSIVGVALPSFGDEGQFDYNDPVGNIYSDGQRLYGIGMEKAYALGIVERIKEPEPVITDPTKPDGSGDASKVHRESSGDANVDVLMESNIEPTAKSIGQFLVDLHPTAAQKKQHALLIAQLGDDSFQKRKAAEQALLTMAIVPIEALATAREASRDAEVSDAATRILTATDGKRSRVLFAALSTIRKKEIKGLASEALATSSMCNQQYLLDALRHALKTTALESDGELLRSAMKDKSASVRIVIATALGAALKEKALPDLQIMAKDAEPSVRLSAATAIANLGDRTSLTHLLTLLEDEDVIIRSSAIGVLRALTGQQIEFVAYDEAVKRKPSVEAWKQWIESHGQTAKLSFPLSDKKFLLGRTLIANYRTGKVTEVDAQGKETWSIAVANPWGVMGLPNGHRLVTSYTQRTVTEYDAKGDKVWEQTNLPVAPFSVERLDNGNTLIACSNSNRVIEVDPANKIVWEATVAGRPTDARRLANGRTLVALQSGQRVVEISREGKEEWQINGCASPISAQRLPNGNTVIAEVSGQRVRELDPTGKEVWSLRAIKGRPIRNPYVCERLDNGNTLVADNQGLYELDPRGEVVWEHNEVGVSRVSRY